MRDERPENTNDTHTTPNPPPDNRDWREQHRERRLEDPLRGLFWGLLLVMLGLLFLANQQNWIADDTWWQYLLIGLGVVFLIDGLAHYWNPTYRGYGYSRFIPGIILLFVGLAFIFSFDQWWPIILIAVGVALLLSFFFRRR
jgi:cobalamin synthase